MKIPDYLNARILFIIDKCPHCRFYKEFIERVNLKLPFDKRIRIVDCTRYYEFGIIDNPLIIKYNKYVKGSFPVLFYRGFRLDGGNSREELEAFINTLVYNDFKLEEKNNFLFDKECQIVKKGIFKNRLICNN
jgi:thiol-disulfide isomerase/thioredoxin